MTENLDISLIVKGFYKIVLIVKAETELEAVQEAQHELAREVLRNESHPDGSFNR